MAKEQFRARYGCDGWSDVWVTIASDAETVTGGTTVSGEEATASDGTAVGSENEGIEPSSILVLTCGALGCANFSFSFN